MASRAARSKRSREIRQLKSEVKDLIRDVRDGNIERADATALAQLYRVLQGFLEIERRREEVDDVWKEIEALKRGILGAS